MLTTSNSQEDVLYARAQELRRIGIDPYARSFARSCTLVEINEDFDQVQEMETERLHRSLQVCGRVSSIEERGDYVLVWIEDQDARLQISITADNIPEARIALLKSRVYRGDYLGFWICAVHRINGYLTAQAAEWSFLTLANLPVPMHLDVQRQRAERHLHLASSLDARERVIKRSAILHQTRRVLNSYGIFEVHTPHSCTAKSSDYSLQHFLVGGIEQVYEMRPGLQPQPLDWLNHPEAMWLHGCLALKTIPDVMQLLEHVVVHVARHLHAHSIILCQPPEQMNTSISRNIEAVFPSDHAIEIDLSPGWAARTVPDLILEVLGMDFATFTNRDQALDAVRQTGLQFKDMASWKTLEDIMQAVFKQFVEPVLIQPTFVMYPAKESTAIERFELVINGIQLGDGHGEIIDPLAFSAADHGQAGLAHALNVGMPPASSFSLNLDRLAMLLLNVADIRDVIVFPQTSA